MVSFVHDFRHAVRGFRQRPGLSAVIVLTLGVGIAANTALFSYLCIFLWPTVDAPRPERLVWFRTGPPERPDGVTSYPDWLDYRRSNRHFSQFAAWRISGTSVATDSGTVFDWCHAVSGDYFALFGKAPHLGRWLGPEDDRPGAPRTLVASYIFWQRHFGGDPETVGRTVLLEGRQPYLMVGVAPPGFQAHGLTSALYIPLVHGSDVLRGLEERERPRLSALARLKDGVSLGEAQAAFDNLARGLDEELPLEHERRVSLLRASRIDLGKDDPWSSEARALMWVVVLFLLLASANVANLLLGRSVTRRREMGIHAALGASRWLLVRRLLAEGALLSLAGGGLGLALARVAVEYLEGYFHAAPVGFGTWSEGADVLVFDLRMAGFSLVVALLSGVLFALAPVLQTLGADLVKALKDDDGKGRALGPRRLLVVVQVALSVVLLWSASLVVQSLVAAWRTDPGFDMDNLLVASLYVPKRHAGVDDEAAGRLALFEQVVDEVRALSGVEEAGLAHNIPLFGGSFRQQITLAGAADAVEVRANIVSSGYLETLGVPLLRGRTLDRHDRAGGPGAVVVNRALAERLWPDVGALGQRFDLASRPLPGETGTFEVVGVVADVGTSVLKPPDPLIYFPAAQRFRNRLNLLLRTAGPSAPVAARLRAALHEDHPDLALIDLQPFEAQLENALQDRRLHANITSTVGLLGLLLAGVGIFSVMSYAVSRRVREIGIRIAVGASARDARILVLREAAVLVGAGVVAGLAVALGTGRLIETMIFGVNRHDPLSFLGVPAVMAALAFASAYLPARRASSVDPAICLRQE